MGTDKSTSNVDKFDANDSLNFDTDDLDASKTVGKLAVTPREVEESLCFGEVPTFRELNESYYQRSISGLVDDFEFIYVDSVGEAGSSQSYIELADQNNDMYKLLESILFNEKRINLNSGIAEVQVSSRKDIYSQIRGFCKDIQCVADSVFGDDWGLRFLMKERFGIVLSGSVDPSTEEYRDSDQLMSVVKAILSFPKGTFPLNEEHYVESNRSMATNLVIAPYRYGEGSNRFGGAAAVTLSGRGGMSAYESKVSNIDVFMLDPWVDSRFFHSRVSGAFHELIHVLDQAKEKYTVLSKTDDWLKLSAWKYDERTQKWEMGKPKLTCSEYGSTLPQEDFAECGSMYRYAPRKLKKISKTKYNFFKNRVFSGIEYDKLVKCSGSVEAI